MRFNITARHIALTPAITDYARKKVEKTQKFFIDIIWAQAILSVEKLRHIAEFVVHTPGETFRTEGVAGDLYAAIDIASHKLDLHLKKVKEKTKNYRSGKSAKSLVAVSGSLRSKVAESEAGVLPSKISDVSQVNAKWMTIEKALTEIESGSKPHFIFVNESTNRINLIYKKSKKGFGLVELEEPHF